MIKNTNPLLYKLFVDNGYKIPRGVYMLEWEYNELKQEEEKNKKGEILMKNEEFDYKDNLIIAKANTVFSLSIVWIKDVLEHKKTDRERFEEIKKIIDETVKHIGN